MLIRHVAVIGALIVTLRVRRINDAVLLVEHDVIAHQAAADREHRRIKRKLEEDRIARQRQTDRVVLVDLLKLWKGLFFCTCHTQKRLSEKLYTHTRENIIYSYTLQASSTLTDHSPNKLSPALSPTT